MAIIRYLQGYLRIRITGFSPERFINMCSYHHIYLWGLKPHGHDYEMYISVKGFRKLKDVAGKTGTRVYIVKKYGLPFYLHRYRKRKLFFAGILFCVGIVYMLSLFIWDIHIDGNNTRTDQVILEFLATKNVRHGMRKSEVDCDRIVKDIRKEFDDIVWVSASVSGTRLFIRVKENTDTITAGGEEAGIRDVVADKDGVVTEIITRQGVPLVHVGDEIKKGDILVSARVEVKNDSQEVIGYQYHDADADIYAQTTEEYQDQILLEHAVKQYEKYEHQIWYVKIGRVKISIGSKKITSEVWELHTEESRIKIGENFFLPICFGRVRIRPYRTEKEIYTQEEAKELLNANFRQFCEDLEKKGVQILENDVKIYTEKNQVCASGYLTLSEPVGIKRNAEVVETPQSTDADSVTEREE